uniref:Uncharacterized protein n=1 Tax=Arundo donax TaxID=35708 RepID=A0A0A9EN83_ARUDO
MSEAPRRHALGDTVTQSALGAICSYCIFVCVGVLVCVVVCLLCTC